jgi:hypothetical protein
MPYPLLLLLLTSPFYALSQITHVRGKVMDSQANKGFWSAIVLFKQADKVITGASTDSTGIFVVKRIPIGVYTVTIESVGYRTKTLPNVVISADTLLPTISFPGPCQYLYSKEKPISCMGGHTDHIVPIVYGLPGKRLLEKAKKEKVYLAGCQTTGCAPQYYCVTHKKEL